MITGITHIAMRVTDVERSLDFYTRQLGLKESFRLNNQAGDLMLVYIEVAKGQFLELFPGGVCSLTPDCSSGPVHMCFQVDDIQKTYAEFTATGVVTRGEPMLGADGAWQFWTADPDGCPIEFHQFTEDSMQLK